MGKGQSFLIHGVGKTEDPRAKKKKKTKSKTRLDDYLIIYTKLNSKFMKDFLN